MPHLLLLDEPTSGLDPDEAAEVRGIIKNLQGSATLVLSSRLLHDIRELCGRVVVLGHGRALADGPTRRICEDTVEERRLTLEIVAEEPIREAIRSIPGVKTIQVVEGGGEQGASTVRLTMPAGVDLRREISTLCARRGWLATEMHLEPPTLDDIFRRLSKGA